MQRYLQISKYPLNPFNINTFAASSRHVQRAKICHTSSLNRLAKGIVWALVMEYAWIAFILFEIRTEKLRWLVQSSSAMMIHDAKNIVKVWKNASNKLTKYKRNSESRKNVQIKKKQTKNLFDEIKTGYNHRLRAIFFR